MKQRILTFLLALLSVSVWAKDYKFSGGSGTEEEPYLISNVTDLKNMAEAVNQGTPSNTYNKKHYKLTTNLTLSPDDVASWEPIGPIQYFFTGSFDGDGHTISGFNVTHEITSDRDIFGFFGHIENGAIIQNFNLVGEVEITKSATDSHQYPVHSFGGICAEMDGASIINCTFSGKLNVEISVGSTLPKGIAGICGMVEGKGGNITNCSNSSEIIISMKNINNTRDLPIVFGGVIGYSYPGLYISNCYNTGDIKVNMLGNNIMGVFLGGISGQINDGSDYTKIGYCYNEGNITVSGSNNKLNAAVGGIFGLGNISEGNCYNIGDINIEDIIVENNGTYVLLTGGIVGNLTNMSLRNCYNYGNIQTNAIKGNVYTTMSSSSEVSTERCYYLLPGIGDEANDKGKVDGMSMDDFKAGKVAWLLRQLNEGDGSYVFGQKLTGSSPDEYPKLQCFDSELPAVYQLKYITSDKKEVTQYYNSGQTIEKLPDLENTGWFDQSGIEYKNGDKMPVKDLVLEAKTGYGIMIDNIEHGKISIEPQQTLYIAGTSITLTVTADKEYKLESLECKTDNNDAVKIENNNGTYSFTMPEANVTISATFEKIKYKVTTNVAEGCEGMGIVSESGDYAEGEDVTVTATPNEGYEFDSWEIVGPDSYTPDGNVIKFVMPAKDVTITAKFKETETPGIPVSYNDLYIIKSEGAKLLSRYDKKRTPDGGSFTLSLEKEEGYEDCEPTVYYKRGRFGEWKELKLDEVSGYYQIRSVYTDIYVKVSGDGIWPVSNEKVEAQEVKVYTQNGAIVVSSPSLMDVQIISMTGSVVAADKVAGQREFRNLAEGIYVVRVGEEVVKVRL